MLGDLALASIQRRDIDAAVGRLHQAIDVVEQTRGGGAARELRPWRDEPAVQDMNDRLLALMAGADVIVTPTATIKCRPARRLTGIIPDRLDSSMAKNIPSLDAPTV
ncbi:hypothetical protein DMB66_34070 [Actinoplanes sp. ATCC 53533]|uniref:hypothetical protein n=1 Tax=Actinoplanes sp. ATCC 53533 TaxID=1288362 RepID=UPI000F76E525|nr:hypothetical protein [Actinoplanes sp. ATCC 53533]RSM56542.1 hypothetical protein DMB66_34070 [Actinoplanes sp. ATCC 53533]